MFKRIFPRFRYTDNTFIDGQQRQPLSFRDAISSLQERLTIELFGKVQEPARDQLRAAAPLEDVMATITHTRLQSMLGSSASSGTTFTYRSKASQTNYNLPMLNANGTVRYLNK